MLLYIETKEKEENQLELIAFRKKCKLKSIKFIVANDLRLAVFLRSDGIYLSAHNLGFKSLNLKKLNFEIIGSAHNIKEIVEKKDKGVKRYCFQSYFWLIIKKIQIILKSINLIITFQNILKLSL